MLFGNTRWRMGRELGSIVHLKMGFLVEAIARSQHPPYINTAGSQIFA
jgi:hypothetical protein